MSQVDIYIIIKLGTSITWRLKYYSYYSYSLYCIVLDYSKSLKESQSGVMLFTVNLDKTWHSCNNYLMLSMAAAFFEARHKNYSKWVFASSEIKKCPKNLIKKPWKIFRTRLWINSSLMMTSHCWRKVRREIFCFPGEFSNSLSRFAEEKKNRYPGKRVSFLHRLVVLQGRQVFVHSYEG